MPKFKSSYPYIKSIVVHEAKTNSQKVHNIAPGGEFTISEEDLALSHGFKALISPEKFSLVSVVKEQEKNPDPVEDTPPIYPDEEEA